jgi:hypothetical protein
MPKHEEHICRFNDGESSCECYDEGFEAGKKETNNGKTCIQSFANWLAIDSGDRNVEFDVNWSDRVFVIIRK